MLNTLCVLKKSGIEFLRGWMFAGTPFWMRTKHGRLLGIPYALDMNDVMTFALDRNTADEYYARFKAAADYFP